jgi:hypothetical protein
MADAERLAPAMAKIRASGPTRAIAVQSDT